MLHANAPLSELGRLRLARCVVDDGWPIARAAERFQVSQTTARRWASRYRQFGREGMVDRSSRPHRCPRATPTPLVRKIVHLRTKRKLGPAQIAPRLGMHASTVHRVLVRRGLSRLADNDRATGTPLRVGTPRAAGARRHQTTGQHPAGGGWRFTDVQTGRDNRRASTTRRRPTGNPFIGCGYVHAAVDDHSRLAYAEVLPDETAASAVGFWHRAHAYFSSVGITVERVLTDNGAAYRSRAFAAALAAAGVRHKRTRAYRPQTNGKVERFNRTLLNEWAYAKLYRSESARRAALPRWLHIYNHHRSHTALGGKPPASRVPNLSGQNS